MHPLSGIKKSLEEKPYIISIVICIAIFIWMLTGPSQAEQSNIADGKKTTLPKVKVERLTAETVFKTLSLYGRSEPDKIANVSSYEVGQVEAIFVNEGEFVTKGTVVAQLEQGDLSERIESVKALIKQREFEYQGAKKLQQQGLQDQVALAKTETALAQAKAELAGLALSLERTTLSAPFAGVINRRLVEVGDYVGRGDAVFELADLDPLIIRADVTQAEVKNLTINQQVTADVFEQSSTQGLIRYIASVADSNTNTFRIEAAFSNPNMTQKAGFSAQLNINAQAVEAIKLSPAFMALDGEGNIGVKSIDSQNKVIFNRINIVKSSVDGIWMTGLGSQADIITLGQGFVRIGDEVEPVYSNEQE
ncbi:efflux RND transporter periplasmic adaptor subunit [Pseudoalteromonas tunicata]|uniref:efflux RND transporter periplasmic adaptor subunit n=1 Tax=Pseudoalteromonas tunicata TaxID=314281 RepID=UPI00273F41F7|nr:efflux RND transporter periplasmic adaptor subunit [Pseudoalteromonas tunicata]MDP4985022.1 efflux RND transporter periplasmic adaptor subunit [Pseudoalteromonas tunicata]